MPGAKKQNQKPATEGFDRIGPLFFMPDRVAFAGASRAGKDEACQPFYNAGYVRHSYGDLLKTEVDDEVRARWGFSAFTERDEEKTQIRKFLEDYGVEHRDRLMATFLATLPKRAIHPRLFDVEQAIPWKKAGGLLIEVRRVGLKFATPFEEKCITELREGGYIDGEILNPLPVRPVANPGIYRDRFHALVREVFGLPPVGRALADLYAKQPGVEAAWVIK